MIEGSATAVEDEGNPPAESGNAAVPAEQSAASANQSAPMPAVRDVMSQPAVKRAMPAIIGLLSLLVVLIFWSVMTLRRSEVFPMEWSQLMCSWLLKR